MPSEASTGERPPPRFNMAAYAIGRAARATPEKTALLVLEDVHSAPVETWSYAALEAAVLNVAGGLAASGLAPGERLLIRLENRSDYAILFLGAIAAGLVPIATSSHLTEDEAHFLIADSGAAAVALSARLALAECPAGVRILSADDVSALIRSGPRGAYADTAADAPAFLVYTSGTTARPKGVLHAQRSAWGRRPMYAGWYGLTAADRMLHAGAFNWTFTLGTGLVDPWAVGATAIVYTGEKDPALWPALIRASGATLFAAVPGVIRQMLKYAAIGTSELGVLRHALVAGETPPAGLLDDWEQATGRPIYEALGMSEISTYISSGPGVPRRPARVGRPQPGRRVAILAENGGNEPLPAGATGLLAVHRSDPGLMLGYWRRPEEEAEVMRGEWFVGGDLALIDTDGYVAHLGRANDIMKALGYRVAPQEVEEVLARFPGVAEVACAEVRVRDDVTVIGAFVVPADGAAIDASALLAHAAEHLAPYKCPREVRFVPALPRTANGKVMRRALT
ncbi:MAG: AMP-binding protein [Pseudomonadota bacterium]